MNGFVNPYNFISFPKQKAHAYPEQDVHTGVIEYSITTETPLFIPNSSSDKAFRESDKVKDHKSYDFFSYENLDSEKHYEGNYHEPVIPGSEIRGVVRSVYETLTDSCMGILNSEKYPVKRIVYSYKPALIHRKADGTMELCAATSYRIGKRAEKDKLPVGFEKYRNGTEMYFKIPEKQMRGSGVVEQFKLTPSVDCKNKGYLIKWGMGVKKARYHVFSFKMGNPFADGIRNGQPQRKESSLRITKDQIENKLYPIIDSYLSQPALNEYDKKAYEEYRDDLKNFLSGKKEGYFPVNCSRPDASNTRIFYLSPAVFTKETSNNSLGMYAGGFAPCIQNYCPACALFGYVGKDNTFSKSSKIRFSDLYVSKKQDARTYYAVDKITLENLGEPKLGNVDFYLKQPEKDADFWTYDYYVKNKKLILKNASLRGRKFYWHHRKVNLHTKIEATNLNKTIRPVKAGITFRGQLFFDSISEKQLRQLIWILNSGKEQIGLKLGGAKPLGFGSVSLNVECVKERKLLFDHGQLQYITEDIPFSQVSYHDVGFSSEVKDEFYKIAGLHSIPEDVEIKYPKNEQEEGYEWFVNNRISLSGGGMPKGRNDIKIKQSLPYISYDDITLKYNFSNNKKKRRE